MSGGEPIDKERRTPKADTDGGLNARPAAKSTRWRSRLLGPHFSREVRERQISPTSSPPSQEQRKRRGNMPRASEYSDEIAALICERLAEGESLRSICLDEDMPSQSMVFRWLAADENSLFREQYARARETQADALFDEILDIADDGSNDWMERKDSEGENIGWKENGEALQRSRLRVDARKWMAGKLQPKKYGEAQTLTVNHGLSDEAATWLGFKSAS